MKLVVFLTITFLYSGLFADKKGKCMEDAYNSKKSAYGHCNKRFDGKDESQRKSCIKKADEDKRETDKKCKAM